MIKTRIAGTAAIFTFGLAALGGTVVAIAAPANADPLPATPRRPLGEVVELLDGSAFDRL